MIEGHGDDLYRYGGRITANFSSNLSNWIDAAPLKAYLRDQVSEAASVYPEPRPYTLEARLASVLRIDAENVCATAGATEAIYLIAQAFAGEKSAVLQPTFSEYADACRIHGHRVVSLYRLPERGNLPDDIRMMWLCNPNNPTGTVMEKQRLIHFIEENPQVVFVVDQSYEDFTLRPLLTPAEALAWPNVLLLHSMTKRYAIPGIRLGYVTGATPLLRHLHTRRMPWSVNGLAIAAGLFLTEHPDAVPFDLSGCLAETARLQAGLRSLGGMDVWDTDTHFMLVRLRMGRASALKDYLVREHGLLIRDASNFEGLDDTYFRISTQRPADNEHLLQAIGQWFMG